MPIKPENRKRYPKDWKAIRAAILERANHRCEQCGIQHHVWRNRETGQWTSDDMRAETWSMDGEHVSWIVLTIAHLDHTPENCDPDNLRAWCQCCHLRYDHTHHAQTAYKTRRAGKAAGDLFAHD